MLRTGRLIQCVPNLQSLGSPAGSVDAPGKTDAAHPVHIHQQFRWFVSCHGRGYSVRIEFVQGKPVGQQVHHLLITGPLGSSTRTIEGIRHPF